MKEREPETETGTRIVKENVQKETGIVGVMRKKKKGSVPGAG